MTGAGVCVDVAGATTGGAARFRGELVAYLARHPAAHPRVIGTGQRLSPTWLARREALAGSSARLATNNISFVGPVRKTVLLRNALHFLYPQEEARLGGVVRAMSTQTRIVRAVCRRADVVVTPTLEMADRVIARVPGVADRIVVRAHPLTFRPSGRDVGAPNGPFVLYPSLPAAHKDAAAHVRRLERSLRRLQRDDRVVVTYRASELPPDLQSNERLVAVGPIPSDAMADWYAAATMIYFPSSVESFGYPLAEGRAAGRPVIAADTAQNAQVAGAAMCGFSLDADDDSLDGALGRADTLDLLPDPGAFDPDAYFGWLLETAARQ